ncbi:hypothetical protein ISN45_Aa03g024160 [Arabidopsis thaliana x Arabidopsis arenosa]|uniref:Transmembrane protein n=1 Tax=Arabidopsis thaliana x Arabidopsis arenosa TaxID=1240361 RepID=A0A8T2AVI5_9BRAS|nr:hypothetical protein ISN45_Aa03g024160 [Arabidopsis thaliana x Arabidopsis arenosa]
MVSDAGEGAKRRRRELALPTYLLWLLHVSPMLSASQTFPPSAFFSDDQNIINGGRRWDAAFVLPLQPLFAISLPKPPSSNDATLKTKPFIIVQSYNPRSDTILPEEHSHRTSLMAGESSLGPSDAPCPVETSTAHGDSFFWAESFWFSDCTSLEKMVSLLTHSIGILRSAPKNALPRSILLIYPVTVSISDHTPPAMSSWDSEQPINPMKRQHAQGKTLIANLDSSYVIGPSFAGPLSFPSQPTFVYMGLTFVTSRPRFAPSIYLSSPNLLLFHYLVEKGRGLQPHIVLKLIVSVDIYIPSFNPGERKS